MKNNIIIKQILLKDLDYEKAAALIRAAFRGLLAEGIKSPTAQITAEELIERAFTYSFCAYNFDNELIGIFLLKDEGEKLYFDICAVKPNYQGQGISKKVFSLVDKLAEEKKYKCIYLNTMETAISNIRFYEYLGYKKTNIDKYRATNYFSIVFYKYFTKNELRNIFILLKFNLRKIYIKKIIYKSPQEITKFWFILQKIKNLLKKCL